MYSALCHAPVSHWVAHRLSGHLMICRRVCLSGQHPCPARNAPQTRCRSHQKALLRFHPSGHLEGSPPFWQRPVGVKKSPVVASLLVLDSAAKYQLRWRARRQRHDWPRAATPVVVSFQDGTSSTPAVSAPHKPHDRRERDSVRVRFDLARIRACDGRDPVMRAT